MRRIASRSSLVTLTRAARRRSGRSGASTEPERVGELVDKRLPRSSRKPAARSMSAAVSASSISGSSSLSRRWYSARAVESMVGPGHDRWPVPHRVWCPQAKDMGLPRGDGRAARASTADPSCHGGEPLAHLGIPSATFRRTRDSTALIAGRGRNCHGGTATAVPPRAVEVGAHTSRRMGPAGRTSRWPVRRVVLPAGSLLPRPPAFRDHGRPDRCMRSPSRGIASLSSYGASDRSSTGTASERTAAATAASCTRDGSQDSNVARDRSEVIPGQRCEFGRGHIRVPGFVRDERRAQR